MLVGGRRARREEQRAAKRSAVFARGARTAHALTQEQADPAPVVAGCAAALPSAAPCDVVEQEAARLAALWLASVARGSFGEDL